MGRTLVSLSRLAEDGWARDPHDNAIDEKSAVLLEPDGKAVVVGSGKGAYFLHVTSPPEVCKPNAQLIIRNISAYRAPAGAHFDLKSWIGDGGESYLISVENGAVGTTRKGKAVY